jgi:hypothetical protein
MPLLVQRAVFSLTVSFVRVMVPLLTRPPPWPLQKPFALLVHVAVFPLRLLSVMVTLPSLKRPPPTAVQNPPTFWCKHLTVFPAMTLFVTIRTPAL